MRRPDPRCEPLIAYWSAVYRFEEAGRWRTLRFVGPAWAERAAPTPAPTRSLSIITAYNPMSRVLSPEENAQRAIELIAELDQRSLAHDESVNAAEDGSWPEHGRVVRGIDRDTLLGLARRFEQRAVVWCIRGQVGLLETATERWLVRAAAIYS